MKPRLNAFAAAPEALEAMLALETYVRGSGLEPTLIELVKTRASQIKRCAYCVELHRREAREAGEREERLHLLTAWQESSFYTDRERAALAWTEALTLVARTHAPDEDYEFFAGALHPGGDGQSDATDRRNQCLEPARDRISQHPSRKQSRHALA